MSQIDPLDRRALGILSSAMNKQLGVSNLVSREVDRAFRSGEIKDVTRAGLLFATLPRWQKVDVQREAHDKAYSSLKRTDKNSERDWESILSDYQSKYLDDGLPGKLPSFLMDRDV